MLDKILNMGVKLTPMMSQYVSIKKNFPDTLLFFRMGDFYELFFDDAHLASKMLNITLTHRGQLGGIPIPMAGIPHHSASTYIDRITSQGHKVAIAEQVQDPKDAVGVVERKVVQIASPGIPYDIEKIDASEHRYICSAVYEQDSFYLSFIDFTTGDFFGVKANNEIHALEKIDLISTAEFISYPNQWENFPLISKYIEKNNIVHNYLAKEYFDPKHSECYIEKLIPSFHQDKLIQNESCILAPIGALSYYILYTQTLDELFHIRPFRLEREEGKLKVSMATLSGLEILPKSSKNYKESLLGYCDKTKSSMGQRELKHIFQNPVSDLKVIKKRQNWIEHLTKNTELIEEIRSIIGNVRDFERIMAKVSTKKINGQDMINLANGIDCYFALANLIKERPLFSSFLLPKNKEKLLQDLAKNIQKTINDEIGAGLEKGNLIREKANKERDTLAQLAQNSAQEVIKLENKYKKQTEINNLKIKFNNVHGHFVEVSKSHLSKVPKHFERRQTLVNAERFSTKELNKLEQEILSAKQKLEQLERKIFNDLVGEISQNANTILQLSRVIGLLDVTQSLAYLAYKENMTKPQISHDQKIVQIEEGWHPLVRWTLKDQFVAHNLILNDEHFFGLITGPNMSGKTTVMREVAIIQFMAQIGSFVPAQKAILGTCDFLFSRLGASDNIMQGQSTFMVEMSETAEILRHSTEKSLILLDEIGRGTSTYDGVSIAWSLLEYLIKTVKSITLFSTHYHELINVVEKLPGAKNLTVEAIVEDGQVEFLYRLIEKGVAQSYGLYVAKLAGLPNQVLLRAQEILEQLEKNKSNNNNVEIKAEIDRPKSSTPKEKTPASKDSSDNKKKKKRFRSFQEVQLSFFANGGNEPENPNFRPLDVPTCDELATIPDYLKKLESDLSSMDIMNMTPLQALEKLQQLQKNTLLH